MNELELLKERLLQVKNAPHPMARAAAALVALDAAVECIGWMERRITLLERAEHHGKG